MDSVWEKIKKSLKEGAAISAEKIEEYTKIGKLKIDEMAAKRKIEHNFMDIGERFFDLSQDGKDGNASEDLVIRKAVETIASLKAEIVEINNKIKEIQEAAKKGKSEEDQDSEDSDDNGV
ncbi:MAG: hypothetical protein LBI42_04425 [Chitinispirillales bacterium]|jgi:hypothetical protein|nr:hypothetical protein [Chitinispirillales bacterium]